MTHTSSFNTIHILGGHKLAYDYSQKINAAKGRGEIDFATLVLIDADASCPAASRVTKPDECVIKSYHDYIIDDLLMTADARDTLVPDHTAPHVMLQVLMGLAQRTRPAAKIELVPFELAASVPFVKLVTPGIWAVSYATWMCPPDCAEPPTCPHTQAERTWDFNMSFASLLPTQENFFQFPCQSLVAEIAHMPLPVITNQTQHFIAKIKSLNTTTEFFVGTHSHCHGIIGKFCVIL